MTNYFNTCHYSRRIKCFWSVSKKKKKPSFVKFVHFNFFDSSCYCCFVKYKMCDLYRTQLPFIYSYNSTTVFIFANLLFGNITKFVSLHHQSSEMKPNLETTQNANFWIYSQFLFFVIKTKKRRNIFHAMFIVLLVQKRFGKKKAFPVTFGSEVFTDRNNNYY